MKRNLCKKLLTLSLIIGAMLVSPRTEAQLGDAGEILKAGTQDANALMKAYLDPFGKGFGAGMNTGWFTSAKPHKTLGFDISLNLSAAIVPSSGLTFNVQDIGLSTLELMSGNAVTPTVNGEDNTNTRMGITYTNPQTGQEETLTEFGMPAGIGFEFVPAPMVQASVGLIKSTDVTVRYIPETDILDFGSVGLIGFGVKHGINQWLPGGKLLPVDISVQGGFTTLTMTSQFDVNPESGPDIKNNYASSTWDNQSLDFEATAYTFNVIVGKKLPFIGAYAGLGYESSTTTIKTPGSYPITSVNPDYNPINDPYTKRIEAIVDPLNIEIEGDNSIRAFAGVEIKLAILKIFANYTLAEYSSANAGFGISFR